MSDVGHYEVNGKRFTEKIEAILEAGKTVADIRWSFFDQEFNRIRWDIEPTLSLPDLYALRAQQIRDEYDYVLVMCSGGADSTNTLLSFLENNIMVDEIVAAAPLSGLNRWDHNVKTQNVENTITETKETQLPFLTEISVKYPKIKITLNDYFEDILKYEPEKWLHQSGDFIHPTTLARFSLNKFSHLKNLAESGKKIGVVYGIDKPSLAFSHGNVYVKIFDVTLNTPRPPFDVDYPNVDVVPFYFTPKLPQLLAKQAHVLAKWISLPQNRHIISFVPDIEKDRGLTSRQWRIRGSKYDRSIRSGIYPDTFKETFQSAKPTQAFFAEHDEWFYTLHNDSKAMQMMLSDFRGFMGKIHPKYITLDKTAFVAYSKEWCIGPRSKFML